MINTKSNEVKIKDGSRKALGKQSKNLYIWV